LEFDNNRIEARDYLRGGSGQTVNLHYWQDYEIIDAILERETSQLSEPRKAFNHNVMWELGNWIPPKSRVLFVGKTHVFEYNLYLPNCKFETLDIDPNVKPYIVGDITKPQDIGQFDAVVFFGVYEVVSDPPKAIKNCELLVKPDGLLIVGAPLAEHRWGNGVYRGGGLKELSALELDVEKSQSIKDYLIGVYRKT